MANSHTVEKIGGSSMSRFGDVMRNVIVGHRKSHEMYNRIFVVSAYSGITNALLEDKKTGEPGVYALFAEGRAEWIDHLDLVRRQMIDYNRKFEELGLPLELANDFISDRIEGAKSCLEDLIRIRSYGHFCPDDYLPSCREML